MTKSIILLLVLVTNYGYGQQDIYDLKVTAEKKAAAQDLEGARNLYREICEKEPKKIDNWYNLAILELALKETDSACEHFYRAHKLGDSEAKSRFRLNCSDFRNGTIRSIEDVDEMPRFIIGEVEHDLFQLDRNSSMDLHPYYEKALIKNLRKSKILRSNVKGKLVFEVHINSLGIFDGRILRATAKDDLIKMELMNILRSFAKYKPAKYGGKPVELLERLAIMADFGN